MQTTWPADKVERRPIDALIPYARNARTHSDGQVAQIAASMKEWGWTNPVLVDESGMIIAGHGRVLAARKLGFTEVPVMVASGWTEPQKKAYVLADNQLAMNAGWDADMLSTEIQELDGAGFDLDLLGFSDIDALLAGKGNEGLTDPDAVPDVPAVPVSALGDVWVMGRHRIICGSSTDAHTVEAVLNGVKPHLMVTDPPYGVEYDASWRSKAMPKKNDAGRWTDQDGRAKGAVLNDDRADWSEDWVLFPGDVAYVWHGSLQTSIVVDSLAAAGFKPRSLIIWAKSHFAIGRGDYHPMHEPCWYLVRDGKTGHWEGDRKQTTLWQIPKPQKSETGHSTQKPIECMKRPIENNSSPGQAIYEPFSGSGTTIIAGEMTARCVYAIELNPAYVDVAVKRWQDFTGQTATLEGDGRTFAEIEAGRISAAA